MPDFLPAAPRVRGVAPAIWAILLLCTAIELVLEGADHGLWGTAQWRSVAISWGGFWPGLLQNWQPNYPGQDFGMFLTYGFLHAGLSHLLGNMLVLLWLGPPVVNRVGQGRFLLIWFLAQIGGGIGYAMLATGPEPMVGASGALFGLAGAWVAWEYVDRFSAGEMLWPVLRIVAMVVLVNVISFWAMSGLIAWQTHLGGFVIGWIAAMLADPRPHTG